MKPQRKNRDSAKHPFRVILALALAGGLLFVIASYQNEKMQSLVPARTNELTESIVGGGGTESVELARKESLGFFTDVSESTWKLYKQRFQFTQPNYDDSNYVKFERHSRYSNWFWSENFEPEFTCPHEFRLGKLGDGGKWVCDPHRIIRNNKDGKCVIYSIGSNGNYEFEVESLEHISKDCEIHTFDIVATGRNKDFAVEANKHGVKFHNWGLGPPRPKFDNMKTFKEIIVDLKHQQSTLDIVKIDCEGCEYEQYQQWLDDWKEMGVTVRQILLEIHKSHLPNIVNIFNEFQKAGYVMFHKEANYISEGKSIEAAFLLLSPDFQKMEE
eukprot:jgi/Psemu1/305669/fgenesh1_kg.211_\